MPARQHIHFAIILIVSSITIEMTLLAGLFKASDLVYHSLHLMLMSALIASQLMLYIKTSPQIISRKYALWFAMGMTATAIGDYVNGALSSVQPVSLKLTWAMLLFGVGYSLYNFSLWHYNKTQQKAVKSIPFFIFLLPVLVLNVMSWIMHVEKNLVGIDVLYYGSFVFNATIYVLMPLLAIQFFLKSKRSTGGLLVLLGALLIPYSDLILFASWLRGGNPAEPSFELYAYNWVVYFSGQGLMTLFPAWVIEAETTSN